MEHRNRKNCVPHGAALRIVASVVLAVAAFSAACQPSGGAAKQPVIELVETVPIETSLGNPELAAALDVWLEMIRGAERSIDFEEFYLSHWPGEPTEQVLEEVGAAAARGVQVRILLDARMYRTYPQPADSLDTVPGISVRRIDMGEHGGGVQHAKFFMVDGREVFIGSQNFDWRALKHIHELGVRVRDDRVTAAFQRVFEMDWAAAAGDVAPARGPDAWDGHVPIAVVQARGDTVLVWPSYSPKRFSPDSTLWDRNAIVRLLNGAEREVVLQLLSYSRTDRGVVDDGIHEALRRAAERGVHVRMLISDWQADSRRIESLEDLAQNENLDVRLSVVPPWSGGYIPFARVEHCKYMVVDGEWTWLGTSNWAPSYFHTSRNVAVTMKHVGLARQTVELFETSWQEPGAIVVQSGNEYTPRIHGVDPPPGQTAYGN